MADDQASGLKPVEWVGSSRHDLRQFPKEVMDEIGFAIYEAQRGAKHRLAKPLKGFKGAGVLEIVESFDGNAYRTVYTIKFRAAIYVLHAFQKKSKQRTKTPQSEIERVERRLKYASEHYQEKYERQDDQA